MSQQASLPGRNIFTSCPSASSQHELWQHNNPQPSARGAGDRPKALLESMRALSARAAELYGAEATKRASYSTCTAAEYENDVVFSEPVPEFELPDGEPGCGAPNLQHQKHPQQQACSATPKPHSSSEFVVSSSLSLVEHLPPDDGGASVALTAGECDDDESSRLWYNSYSPQNEKHDHHRQRIEQRGDEAARPSGAAEQMNAVSLGSQFAYESEIEKLKLELETKDFTIISIQRNLENLAILSKSERAELMATKKLLVSEVEKNKTITEELLSVKEANLVLQQKVVRLRSEILAANKKC
ncbi:unnamed protein product [Amoebophrya sp. A120]|nr:unnamed protein product [Amoebophrya sp. A120]|eukprot:GSA120T00007956001.1